MVTVNLNDLEDVSRELVAGCQAPAPSAVARLSAAEEAAAEIAKLWNRDLLNPAFLPPEQAVYFPFHADPGPFDIIRVWYPTRYGEVLIAQTLCVFSLVIEGGKRDVNDMARRVFKQSDRMSHLRFWADGERLGFLTLKKSETPGRGMMGWDAELNRYWFRAFQRAK